MKDKNMAIFTFTHICDYGGFYTEKTETTIIIPKVFSYKILTEEELKDGGWMIYEEQTVVKVLFSDSKVSVKQHYVFENKNKAIEFMESLEKKIKDYYEE